MNKESEVGLVGRILKRDLDRDGTQVDFAFKVRKKPSYLHRRGKIFIPLSTEQVEKLKSFEEANPETARRSLVRVLTYSRHPTVHTITWMNFYPFGAREGHREPPPLSFPGRLGIGSLVHYAVTEYFARRPKYKGYTISHFTERSPERERQLRKMGINPSEPYALVDYREKVRSAIENMFGRQVKVYT